MWIELNEGALIDLSKIVYIAIGNGKNETRIEYQTGANNQYLEIFEFPEECKTRFEEIKKMLMNIPEPMKLPSCIHGLVGYCSLCDAIPLCQST